MAKIVIPVVENDAVLLSKNLGVVASTTALRNIAKYLYEQVPERVVASLFYALLPSLTHEQRMVVIHQRLPAIANMNMDQLKEIVYGATLEE